MLIFFTIVAFGLPHNNGKDVIDDAFLHPLPHPGLVGHRPQPPSTGVNVDKPFGSE